MVVRRHPTVCITFFAMVITFLLVALSQFYIQEHPVPCPMPEYPAEPEHPQSVTPLPQFRQPAHVPPQPWKGRSGLCVISVRVATKNSQGAGSFRRSPTPKDISYYFVSDREDMKEVEELGWTPVLLDLSEIPFDTHSGPLAAPELGWSPADVDNLRGKYVKILSHMIPELRHCELVFYMDSKIRITEKQVYGAVDIMKARSRSKRRPTCVALTEHVWTRWVDVYGRELQESLLQQRYCRFRPAFQKQIEYHRSQKHSFDGMVYCGCMHIFNLSDPDAISFQRQWWQETISYSIQDQLSLFWPANSPQFEHCVDSWAPYVCPACFGGDSDLDTWRNRS